MPQPIRCSCGWLFRPSLKKTLQLNAIRSQNNEALPHSRSSAQIQKNLTSRKGPSKNCFRFYPVENRSSGQYYDYDMSLTFFDDLDIPHLVYHLEAGPGTHSVQTANIMISFEKICMSDSPDIVLVVDKVNSILACSIVAKKLGIKVAHVEAGLSCHNYPNRSGL